jgi:hypothetical protein
VAEDFEARHPEYQARLPDWTFNRDHFRGGRCLADASKASLGPSGTVRRYLHQHEVEAEKTYGNRLDRSPGLYQNLVSHAIDVYRSHVMRVEAQRDLPDVLAAMALDVDLFGSSAHAFFSAVHDEAQLQGIGFVLVDAPEVPTGLTEAAARDLRLRPWFELVTAETLVDWDIEHDDPTTRGQLKYAVLRDTLKRRQAPFVATKELTRYRVWTPETWQIWHSEGLDGKAVLVKSGVNRVGRVPLVPCYDRFRGPMMGGTVIDEVARKANALWNRSSVRDENFYRQGFSLLVIASNAQGVDKLELGAQRALILAQGDSATYQAPSTGIFEAYGAFAREMIEQAADLVFARTARHQMPSAQVESAAKREVDRREFVALLETKAARMEECERQCWAMAARYYGQEPEPAEREAPWVTYSRDFRVDELEAAEWIERIAAGVASPIEWRLALHPEETEAEAEQAVTENLERWAAPRASANDALPGDDGTDDPEDDEKPEDDPASRDGSSDDAGASDGSGSEA